MALSSGMGLRRGLGIPLRLTTPEKKKLKKLADAVGLSMAEYVRCKTFDIPFHLIGGKETKSAQASS
jgi:mobilization protein NikA